MSLSFPQMINLEAWSEKTLAKYLPAAAKPSAKEIANFVREKVSTEEEKNAVEKLLSKKFDSTLAKQLARIEVLWKVGVSIVEDPWDILSNSIFVSNSQH